MRPKADKEKKLKETPIPPEHLSTVLPLWEEISGALGKAKKNADSVSKELGRLDPTSLASAGATSSSVRVGKLAKVCKVRDLPKSLNAINPALTKTNLAWAGIENKKEKEAQDLVPIMEETVSILKRVSDLLDQIDRILNPRLLDGTPVTTPTKKKQVRIYDE